MSTWPDFKDAHIAMDNDGALILCWPNGDRVMEDGQRVLAPVFQPVWVCDNTLDRFEKQQKEKLSRVPNRKMRRRKKK